MNLYRSMLYRNTFITELASTIFMLICTAELGWKLQPNFMDHKIRDTADLGRPDFAVKPINDEHTLRIAEECHNYD